jgi:hypothetical protein
MGWDSGRYYTRSKKVNGRVVREYIGTGPVAELVAETDIFKREWRSRDALDRRQEKADLIFLDAVMKDLEETTDVVVRAALTAAGYRQHNGGEWRKQRER